MYEVTEITNPEEAKPGERTFVISDCDTHLAFTLSSVHQLNNGMWEETRNMVPVTLLNGQISDAFLELAARLNQHRWASNLNPP